MDAADVLNGKVKVGNKVVMLGVGLVGSETALWLAENGHDVTLVGRGPQIMKGVAPLTPWPTASASPRPA